MLKSKKMYMWITVAIIIFAGFLIIPAIVQAGNRHDFSALLEAIDDGEVKVGESIHAVIKANYAKPTSDVVWHGNNGDQGGLVTYNHNHKILMLYWLDKKLVAAFYVEGVHSSKAEWLFIDRKLLSKTIDLSILDKQDPTKNQFTFRLGL